ncbi:integrase core domain-containing protein [Jannaschia sp. W003]|uniref:integrase core domain-containing protein n=1 Tax=Jannaschia sp. W003 TaxID=2867012 RepID=UPI0038FC8DBA
MDRSRGREDRPYRAGPHWEDGNCGRSNACFRDERLDGEVFYSLRDSQLLVERWCCYYNTVRAHDALSCRPPATEGIVPVDRRLTKR